MGIFFLEVRVPSSVRSNVFNEKIHEHGYFTGVPWPRGEFYAQDLLVQLIIIIFSVNSEWNKNDERQITRHTNTRSHMATNIKLGKIQWLVAIIIYYYRRY